MGAFAKPLTLILGVVFLILGVLGFVQNPVLGLFEIDTMHNAVHLLSGAAALICWSKGLGTTKMYLLVFGAIYGVVAVLGFVKPSPLLGLITVNMMDNYLHTGIAAVCLIVGGSVKRA